MTEVTRHGSDFVQSLERGLAVIRAFDADHPKLTLSEVARATKLNRAAARRFLLTLAQLGYVHNDGRTFSLRPRILELGYSYLSSMELPEIALPHMKALVADVEESSSVSVLDGSETVFVARVPIRRIMTVAIAVGTRFPAHATSMGRVLLAGLPKDERDKVLESLEPQQFTDQTITDRSKLAELLEKVAEQGYAAIDQELDKGLRAIAVPIHDASGQTIASINIWVHASRATIPGLVREFLPKLRETADLIEADLHAGSNL